jgi:hypothetical protein
MNHAPQHHGHHSHAQHGHADRPRRMSGSHLLKLFLLNVVLFGACGAFAGLIMGDWVPREGQLRFLAAVGLVPLVLAVVATIAHAWAGKWTSVDNMSERFFGGRPQ